MSNWNAIGRATVGFCTLAGALSFPLAVRANGAFPAASQLISDPADPDHLVLRTTFGLIVSGDRGSSWDWLCEQGMGYQDVQPPMAVLPGGVILLAVPDGISRSDSTGCDFAPVTDIDATVLDLARVPTEADGAIAISLSGTDAQVWRTTDAGVSFSRLGAKIPDFLPATVDVAPSDPHVMYASGLSGTEGTLLRSTDGFASFETFVVPSTSTAHRPFIAAVDPNDADTVYVRLAGTPSPLQVTHDGGSTFTSPLSTTVTPLGFALSPDGATVFASNGFDGTYRANADTLEFEKLACGGPSCLSFSASGLLGCGDDLVDGFIVGRSDDAGETFQRLVDLSCIRGPLACGPETSIGKVCPGAWPTIQAQIGATSCDPPSVTPYTGCFAGAGNPSGGSDGNAGSGGQAASGGAAGSSSAAGDGCACRMGGRRENGIAPLALGVLWLATRRRRAQRAKRPRA